MLFLKITTVGNPLNLSCRTYWIVSFGQNLQNQATRANDGRQI